MEKIQHKK